MCSGPRAETTTLRRVLHVSLQGSDPGFLRGGANPRGGANLVFAMFLTKNCKKMKKKIGLRGGREGRDPLEIRHCILLHLQEIPKRGFVECVGEC